MKLICSNLSYNIPFHEVNVPLIGDGNIKAQFWGQNIFCIHSDSIKKYFQAETLSERPDLEG